MAVWHERCYGDVYSLDSQNERIDKGTYMSNVTLHTHLG